MTTDVFRFRFSERVPLEEAEMSLHLAIFATEGLFGQACVRLDARYELDTDAHALVIDATHAVGSAIVRIFSGLLLREFGEDAFQVERVNAMSELEPEEICT